MCVCVYVSRIEDHLFLLPTKGYLHGRVRLHQVESRTTRKKRISKLYGNGIMNTNGLESSLHHRISKKSTYGGAYIYTKCTYCTLFASLSLVWFNFDL